MSSMAFEPLPINTSIQNMISIVDDSGIAKFANDQVSSFNFNGFIPRYTDSIYAFQLQIGMKFIPNDTEGLFCQILDIYSDNPDFVDTPSGYYTVVYQDASNELQEIVFYETDEVFVQYEEWNDKVLGDTGWLLTSEGNAIFSNVAVRGEIEATTLDVGGTDGIIYDGNTVTIGASVIINAPLVVGASGNFVVSGSAAQDIVSNNTTITGGNIATGKIKSQGYSGPGTASAFSASGMLINLDDGSIAAPNFKIDNTGNAHFKGIMQSASGIIGGFTVSASQISIAGFTMSTSSGIFLGSSKQFQVDTQGNLVATSASIIGDIQAKSGTFSGSITSTQIYGASVTAGTLLGQNITGASVIGGIITGQQIIGGTITGASGTFTGNLTATSLTASNGTIGGFTITNNSLNANNFGISTNQGLALGSASQFFVDTVGTMRASSASISGDIDARSGRFSGSVTINSGGSLTVGSTAQRMVINNNGLYGYNQLGLTAIAIPTDGTDPIIGKFKIIESGIVSDTSAGGANILVGTMTSSATTASMVSGMILRGNRLGGNPIAFYTVSSGSATTYDAGDGFYVDEGGKFKLSGSNGSLRFDGNNLFVTGAINATSGSFSGWIRSASIIGGIVLGQQIIGASVTGGIITGQQIVGGTITGASGTFTGNLIATNLTASAGTIGGFTITQNSLNSNNFALSTTGGISLGSASQFSVNNAGVLRASTASIAGNIIARSGEISGVLAIVDGGEIYVGNEQNSGQRINIRHTDLTGYSELGFPTFSLITGSAISASPLLQSGGFDNLTSGEDADPPWQSFWGFGGFGGGSMTAIVDSLFFKDGGKSLRVSTASYEGGVSAVSQDVKLIPGEEYVVSAWVYSSRNLQITSGNYVDIWLLSSSFSGPSYFTSGVRISSLIGATELTAGVWTKLSNKFIAPSAPTQYYSLHMREWLPSSASIWWDTIELTRSKSVSTISGFYFNDGELFSDILSIKSDGSAIFGRRNTASAIGTNPDPTNITGVLSISGANPTYRLWSGHLDPLKAGFRLDTNGHITSGLITSSATYNRTDTTAYVSISAAGVLGRYSSTQRIKYDIIPINTLLGPSVDQSKVISSSPSINYKNILSLTPVEYTLIDYPEDKKFGFIAEDVADKLPEIATYDENGPTYFDMAGLIAATLAIVQDQQKNIEDLQNRVLQLESQLGG